MFLRQLVALTVILLTVAPARGAADVESVEWERTRPVPEGMPIPVADFFRPLRHHHPSLNPSGTFFAALFDAGRDKTGLFVCDLKKKQGQYIAGPGNRDIYSLTWLNDDRLLIGLTLDKIYTDCLIVINARDLSRHHVIESGNATSLIAVPQKSRLRPLVWIRHNASDGGKDGGVVQLDATEDINRRRQGYDGILHHSHRDPALTRGATASILRSFEQPRKGVVVDYLPDQNGDLAFAVTAVQGEFSLFRYSRGKPVECPVDLDEIYPFTHGDRANELIVLGRRRDGQPRALQRFDAATGELGEVLCEDPEYDIDAASVYHHPVTKRVLGVQYSRSRPVSVWFDERYRSIQQTLEAALPRGIVTILDSDDQENLFFVAAYSDREPVKYYTFDGVAGKIDLWKNSRPWIDPARMRPMDPFQYRTRDGHSMEAYLTLPAGASRDSPAPLIVLPHGGPRARDTWGFNPEVQFLASRGYAVFQPNYRGSPGYKWRFPAGDEWNFLKMHEDVTDGVRALVRTGMVDPQRIAIMGTSFGGYLAVCGAAFEPNLYRCAITVAGVFDWAQAMAEVKFDVRAGAEFGILHRHLGDYKSRKDFFTAISPLRHVNKIKVPVFIAHGRQDVVVSIDQSNALIAELKKHAVPHSVMLVRGEGHGMQKVDNEIRLYSQIEAFLAKSLQHPASTEFPGPDS